MNTAIAQTSLYYTEGRSDKEYHAEIVEVAGGNVVNFRYGRRGGALTSGTKTSTPVDFTQAKKIFDKLIHEKTAKGYTPAVSGSAYQGTEQNSCKSDFTPQLLNSVSEADTKRLLQDDHWATQQKMDGERRAAHADGHQVLGMNRKGLVVPLPQSIVDELHSIALSTGSIRLDGEIIGDDLYVFDMHIHQGIHLHTQPWIARMRLAWVALLECKHLKALPYATTSADKYTLFRQVELMHGEGVVFKRMDSVVMPGRPNSGGDWLKFKFTESASCVVLAINTGKRSVKLGMLDSVHPSTLIPVGNVTIPLNYEIPPSGQVVEVQYLYAYQGGSLYQPVYRGARTDIDKSVCTLQQLKFKPQIHDEEDA